MRESLLLLDTNVLINLNRNGAYMAEVMQPFVGKYKACISMVTYGEFVGGERMLHKAKAHKAANQFLILPTTSGSDAVFARWAKQVTFRKQRVADMLIASVAADYKIPLLTANGRDFQGLKGLKLFVYSQP